MPDIQWALNNCPRDEGPSMHSASLFLARMLPWGRARRALLNSLSLRACALLVSLTVRELRRHCARSYTRETPKSRQPSLCARAF